MNSGLDEDYRRASVLALRMIKNLLEIKIFNGENSWGRLSDIALQDGVYTHGSTQTQTHTSESVVFALACSQNYDMSLYLRSQLHVDSNIAPQQHEHWHMPWGTLRRSAPLASGTAGLRGLARGGMVCMHGECVVCMHGGCVVCLDGRCIVSCTAFRAVASRTNLQPLPLRPI